MSTVVPAANISVSDVTASNTPLHELGSGNIVSPTKSSSNDAVQSQSSMGTADTNTAEVSTTLGEASRIESKPADIVASPQKSQVISGESAAPAETKGDIVARPQISEALSGESAAPAETKDDKKEEMERMIREKQKELLQLKLADARKKVSALRQQAAATQSAAQKLKLADPRLGTTQGVAAASSSAVPASTTVPSASAAPANSTASTLTENGGTRNEDLQKKRETLLGLLEKRRRLNDGDKNARTPAGRNPSARPRWTRGACAWDLPRTPSAHSDEESQMANCNIDEAATPSADSDAEFVTADLLRIEDGSMPRPGVVFVMKDGVSKSSFVLPLG